MLEQLEVRCLLATVSWISPTSGDWEVGGNWSNGTGPSALDDAVIDVPNITVTHGAGIHSIASLTTNDHLVLARGTLAIAGQLRATNGIHVTLAGATLQRATLITTGGAELVTTSGGGTLDGVTLGGSFEGISRSGNFNAAAGGAVVMGGLAFANGSVVSVGSLTTSGSLQFAGDQIVGGAGEFRFVGNGGTLSVFNQITFGAGLMVHGTSAILSVSGGLTNHGLIRSDAGGLVTVDLNVTGATLLNAVDGVLSADGGTLTLNTAWTNAGQIVVNNSTLNLGGSFTTAGLGTYTRSGGTINLTGQLNNTGNTLKLDALTGSWNLRSPGTLKGGALVTSGGAELVASSGGFGGTLNGVTLGGSVSGVARTASFNVANGNALISGGLTFANGSVIQAGGPGTIGNFQFTGNQTVGGTGEFRFFGSGGNFSIFDSLTLGTGLTVHGTSAIINVVTGSLINHSLIKADGGGTFTVSGNPGTTLLNAADGVLVADGGSFSLENTWSNLGQIVVNNSTLNLGGSFTTAGLGAYTRTGGTINLTGRLDNTGNTLALNALTGSWNLRLPGTIKGGALVTTGGAEFIAGSGGFGGTLDGVTLGGTVGGVAGTASFNVANGNALIRGGLTFANGSVIQAGGPGTIGNFQFTGDQTIGGSGEFRFLGSGGNFSIFDTLTLGAGLKVHGTSATINTVVGSLVNHSLIKADGGGTFTITGNPGTTLLNAADGLLAADGGSFSLENTWSNLGQIVVNNSTLNLGGNFTTAGLGAYTRTGGSVNLNGVLDNTGTSLGLASDLNLTGTIIGGTLSTSGTGKLLLNRGTLMGVTLASVAEVQSNSFIKGGLTLNGGQLIVNASSMLTFQAGNQVFNGNGTVVFAGTGGSLEVEANRQLTLGAGLVISASTGTNSLIASAGGASGVIYSTISTPIGATVSLVGNWTDHSTRIVPTNSTDGGPITRGVPTPGKISVAGERDNWTYFARAGQSLSIFLNAANGISPPLGFAQLQILDPANNVIGTATGTVNGQSVQLAGFTFPADGNYTIRVQASPAQPAAVGNYLLSVYEATVDTRRLVLNQQVTGALESHYSTDRWIYSAKANQQVQLHLLGVASTGIRFQLTGPNGFVGFTDLNADSGLVNLPTTGSYVLQVAGNLTGFGAYTLRLDATSQTSLALDTTYRGSLFGSGFAQLFNLDVTQSTPLLIHLDDAINSDRTEIYAKLGSPPTRQTFDARFETNGADHRLTIPLAVPGVWYVLVYGDRVSGANDFTLLVQAPLVVAESVSPNYAGVGEQLQLTISGLGFVPGTRFDLVPVGGTATISAQRVSIDSTTRATATFDLTGASLGNYDIRVTLPTGASSSLPGVFKIGALGITHLETHLILPGSLGRHGVATLYVEYENTGTIPMAAPILIMQSSDPDNSDRPLLTLDQSRVTQGFWTSAIPDGFANSVQIYASGASPGLLQAGEKVRVPVYYAGLQQPWDFSDTGVELELRVHTAGDPATIDWPSLEAGLRPDWIAQDVWPVVFENLQSQVGGTWGDYVRMLGENATYLSRLGQKASSIDQLYGFEVQQALGLDPVGTITSVVDASAASPGLPLTFRRSFGNTISERYRVGPFGRGWNSSWQQSAEPLTDGTVIVHESADAQRRFQPDSRRANTFFSQTGDTGTLRKVTGGAFELTEMSGSVTQFLADGRLDLVRDTYKNTITAGYTNNRLTSLTHSSGKSLGITYNAAGRIASITDPFGRPTTFAYDPTDSLLLTATDAAGTTTYTYSTDDGAARKYALTSVTDPSGVRQSFEYDMRGRLTGTYVGANIDRTAFAYDDAGTVTITDAAGDFSKIFFDKNRQVARVEGSTGYYVSSQFDAKFRPVAQMDAQGASQTTTWTATGAVRTLSDELGATTTFTPGGPLSQPLSLIDARGSTTRYAYDAKGKVTATTYADNSVERTTYDVQGNRDVLTNRRGQSNDLTFSAAGHVTHEARSDGTTVDYSYDTLGRLQTATDASGTTTLSHDAADRLTKVEYPNGRWIQYAYDAAGRRTRLEDQTGFVVQYAYDSAGRIAQLFDTDSALIVRYAYDAPGRLSREDKGNGTFTIYGYDVAGRVVGITHHAPDNSVNAAFGYTYDLSGRRVAATTPEGGWTYTYDLTDQLIRAVFASTNPGISNQDLNYEYDALGNRVRTMLNGVTANYTANNLNQYTAVGSTTFSYDLDGNLVQETGASGTKSYTYDSLNRLTRVQSPQGVWQYEYDVLGNRTAMIVNAQRTEYLIDPTGIGDVVGEIAGGNLVAHYAHGLGLASRVDAGGSRAFYGYEANGNTAQLTGQGGTVLNSYSYLPFGQRLSASGTTPNPFTFVGQFGVMAEDNGMDFMRNRFYDQTSGRFTKPDPIRLGGGDVNLYRYVTNGPLSFIDPSGLAGGGSSTGGRGGGWVPEPPKYLPKDLGSGYTSGGPGYRLGCQISRDVFCNDGCKELRGFEGPLNDSCKPEPPQPPEPPEPCAPYPSKCSPFPPPQPPPPPPPPIPPTPPCDSGVMTCTPAGPDVPKTLDPNEKLGASGYGPAAYILPDTVIPYRIDFENLGPGSVPAPAQPATAPAQRVEVTDQLSTNFDWDTVLFTEFGFGDTIVTVPDGRANYIDTVSMTYNNHTFDVQVELAFDSSTGLISAVYQSLDPGTALPPEVLTGFLPPEDGTGIGKAHFSYSVQPKPGLPTGTALRNIALIRFDGQTTIATNQVDPQNPVAGTDPDKEALNTIDAGPPSSQVLALPSTTATTQFTVRWNGQDDAAGSGISSYDVYASDNGGLFTRFQQATVATSATFKGLSGHTYGFYSVATDNVGNRESAPTLADAITTTLALIPWQNPLNPLDVDDSGDTNPLDVLVLINDLNISGSRKLTAGQNPADSPRYLDVDGDGFASPLDALVIINFINRRGNGEGESLQLRSLVRTKAEETVDVLMTDLSWLDVLEKKRKSK